MPSLPWSSISAYSLEEIVGGVSLEPSAADAVDGGLPNLVLLIFAGGGALEIAHDALAPFTFARTMRSDQRTMACSGCSAAADVACSRGERRAGLISSGRMRVSPARGALVLLVHLDVDGSTATWTCRDACSPSSSKVCWPLGMGMGPRKMLPGVAVTSPCLLHFVSCGWPWELSSKNTPECPARAVRGNCGRSTPGFAVGGFLLFRRGTASGGAAGAVFSRISRWRANPPARTEVLPTPASALL